MTVLGDSQIVLLLKCEYLPRVVDSHLKAVLLNTCMYIKSMVKTCLLQVCHESRRFYVMGMGVCDRGAVIRTLAVVA